MKTYLKFKPQAGTLYIEHGEIDWKPGVHPDKVKVKGDAAIPPECDAMMDKTMGAILSYDPDTGEVAGWRFIETGQTLVIESDGTAVGKSETDWDQGKFVASDPSGFIADFLRY